MRTYTAKPSDIHQKWYVVDATGAPVGRLAGQVAKIIRGKHKPIFTPHMDTGDFVIIINAEKAVLTGNKGEELVYWHTMYPGGLKSISRAKMFGQTPEKALLKAIKGMIPHNKLGAQVIKKVKIYRGSEHPHEAQQPEELKLEY